jgi:hypothetical protein
MSIVVWAPLESIVLKLTVPDIVVLTILPLAERVVVAVSSSSSVLNYFLSLKIVTVQLES